MMAPILPRDAMLRRARYCYGKLSVRPFHR